MARMGRRVAWTLLAGLCASTCTSSRNARPSLGDFDGNAGPGTGGSGATAGAPALDAGAVAGSTEAAPPVATMDGAPDSTDGGGGADEHPDAGGGCPPGALLCDGFESYASPADLAAAWTPMTTAATMTVDGTKAWRGTKALHIKGAAGMPSAVIVKEGAPLFPIAGNVMFGRVMLWLAATPSGGYHWNSIQSAGTIPTSNLYGKYGWGGQNGKVLAGYTVRTTPSGAASVDCSKPSAMAFPTQRWACVEWEFDGNKNEMHLWFDGALLADADIVGQGTRCVNGGDLGKPWTAPTFANLILGWQQYQASTGPLELWMDDVAVGATRMGCQAP
jgi:hypothetical protein